MKIQPGNGKQKKDISLNLLHGEAASSSVENAGCAYQSASLIATGATAQGVALLSTLTNLVLSILLIKVPSLVEGKHASLKRITILVAIVSAVTWLPIIFVMLFMKNVSPLLLTGLWIMGLVSTVLLYPLRDNWLASLVPSEKMGRYLSWRSVIAGVFYLATFYTMGWILDITAGHESRSYAFIFSVAFLASTITVVLLCIVRPPATRQVIDKQPALGFVTFLKQAKKSHLGTFIFFVSLYTFAVNLAGPLFASYMLRDLRFSYMTFTAVVSCEYIARIISLTFWGKQVDKAGSLRILSTVAYLIPFIPIMWIFSGNFLYLCGIQILGGTVWAAFDLCVQTFIYKATPPEQRLRYIVYHRSLTSFSVAVGAITGAFLLNRMFTIHGSQILALFLVSGILRMVIARIMVPKLSLQGIPEAVVHPELAAELAVVPGQRLGLYYYPDSWRRFTRKAATFGGNIIGRTVSRLGISQNGLFYNPARWAEYMTRAGMQPVRVQAEPFRDGLYYHRPARRAQQNREIITSKSGQQAVRKEGLFHYPERWTDYLRQSMALNAATMRTGGEGMTLREPVFYHPELWEKYQKDTAKIATKRVRAPVTRNGLLYKPEEWQKYKEQTAVRRPKKAPVTIGTTLSANSPRASTNLKPVTAGTFRPPPGTAVTTRRFRAAANPA